MWRLNHIPDFYQLVTCNLLFRLVTRWTIPIVNALVFKLKHEPLGECVYKRKHIKLRGSIFMAIVTFPNISFSKALVETRARKWRFIFTTITIFLSKSRELYSDGSFTLYILADAMAFRAGIPWNFPTSDMTFTLLASLHICRWAFAQRET